jgi:hypothetical protein
MAPDAVLLRYLAPWNVKDAGCPFRHRRVQIDLVIIRSETVSAAGSDLRTTRLTLDGPSGI